MATDKVSLNELIRQQLVEEGVPLELVEAMGTNFAGTGIREDAAAIFVDEFGGRNTTDIDDPYGATTPGLPNSDGVFLDEFSVDTFAEFSGLDLSLSSVDNQSAFLDEATGKQSAEDVAGTFAEAIGERLAGISPLQARVNAQKVSKPKNIFEALG